MRNLDDIIRYEGESTYVDFKQIPYIPYKEKKVDLIKDIMSLANADVDGDRYIIIGVDFDDKKQRILVGVSSSDIPDPAEYQQLIYENIEPDIKFDVFSHPLDDKVFGIIQIESCENGPYVMRKEFGPLKKGDQWIRKGSFQTRLLRSDLEKIYADRYRRSKFNGEIKISFDENGCQEAVFPAIGKYFKPSDYYKQKIEQALDRKRNPPLQKKLTSIAVIMQSIAETSSNNIFSNPLDYDRYSITDLEEKLAKVHEDFKEDDEYDLYQEHGQPISLIIMNNSDRYLEDVQLTLEMPRNGICVAEKVYDKPSHGMFLQGPSPETIRSRLKNYPSVKYTESSIVITQKIGDIPHLLPKNVFEIQPRAVFSNDLIGTTFKATCTIYARNLETRDIHSLKIQVVEPDPIEDAIIDASEED